VAYADQHGNAVTPQRASCTRTRKLLQFNGLRITDQSPIVHHCRGPMAPVRSPRTAQTGAMMHVSKRMTEIAGLAAVIYAARSYYRNWGTSKGECQARMPGDELVGDPAIQVTEALWVDSPPAVTWPSLLRLGQDRGARYSRRALEVLAGFRVQRAAGRDPEWTPLAAGDRLQVKPEGWMGLPNGLSLRVESIAPERSLVLVSPDLPSTVWSFHLEPHWATHTRLISRARVGLRHPGEVVALELARPAIALAMRKMLMDIKRQVEQPTNDFAPVGFRDAAQMPSSRRGIRHAARGKSELSDQLSGRRHS
jgi:hypothetical protein